MKKSLYTLFGALLLLSALFVTGCKDDAVEPTKEDKTVPNDVFPLTAGTRFDYTGHFTNQDTETPIAGTSTSYSTSWSIQGVVPFTAVFNPSLYPDVAANITAANGGRTSAVLVMDSTLVFPPLAPITFKKPTPVFAYYDSSSNDYYYMTNFGYFFRSLKVNKSASDTTTRQDSLRFILLASPKVGVGNSFTAFQGEFVSYALGGQTVTLTVTGVWKAKEDVTVNAVKYSTYYLEVSRDVRIKGAASPLSSGFTAKIWLAKGIGPVKMFLAGDVETPGNYRELKTKTP